MIGLVFVLVLAGIALLCVRLSEITKETVQEIVDAATPPLPDPLDEEFRQLEAEVAKRDVPDPVVLLNAVNRHHHVTWDGLWGSANRPLTWDDLGEPPKAEPIYPGKVWNLL